MEMAKIIKFNIKMSQLDIDFYERLWSRIQIHVTTLLMSIVSC